MSGRRMTPAGLLGAVVLALALGLPGATVAAVQPDEVLDDPVLEARARAISAGLRCVVCRNESIDDSNAEIARDMRILLRERLVAGDSDDEVLAFFVERYGEFVLFRPQTDGSNIILWISGPALALIGLGSALVYVRRRRDAGADAPDPTLSGEEEARLRELLRD